MADNSEAFRRVVLAWVDKAKAAPIEVVRETVQDMNNAIVASTPVDTGFLRASYYASLNEIPSGQGGTGTSAINAILVDLKAGDTYVMGNVAAYARRVELGFVGQDSLGRTYNQRGRFWIAAVLDRAGQFMEAAAARVGAR